MKIGDTVYLKEFGLKMLICDILEILNRNQYCCCWLTQDKVLIKEWFQKDALQTTDPKIPQCNPRIDITPIKY